MGVPPNSPRINTGVTGLIIESELMLADYAWLYTDLSLLATMVL